MLTRYFCKSTSSNLNDIVSKTLQGHIKRGMRVSVISSNAILLEDIEEWAWKDFASIQWMCPHEVTMDIFSASGSALPGLAIIITAVPQRGLAYFVRCFLATILYALTAFWAYKTCDIHILEQFDLFKPEIKVPVEINKIFDDIE